MRKVLRLCFVLLMYVSIQAEDVSSIITAKMLYDFEDQYMIHPFEITYNDEVISSGNMYRKFNSWGASESIYIRTEEGEESLQYGYFSTTEFLLMVDLLEQEGVFSVEQDNILIPFALRYLARMIDEGNEKFDVEGETFYLSKTKTYTEDDSEFSIYKISSNGGSITGEIVCLGDDLVFSGELNVSVDIAKSKGFNDPYLLPDNSQYDQVTFKFDIDYGRKVKPDNFWEINFKKVINDPDFSFKEMD